ncbi:hypothetical protein FTV88_1163 [Heliorestis convoluta]|uniref:Uncharacterized protein n=1 Tax=Heliorestis convoluta TaxID=356322 RepID=A0A5Q2N4Y0_9FIRM|nr:hypothetical protein FTV88_1163 [Heliorestis convoluta]
MTDNSFEWVRHLGAVSGFVCVFVSHIFREVLTTTGKVLERGK